MGTCNPGGLSQSLPTWRMKGGVSPVALRPGSQCPQAKIIPRFVVASLGRVGS